MVINWRKISFEPVSGETQIMEKWASIFNYASYSHFHALFLSRHDCQTTYMYEEFTITLTGSFPFLFFSMEREGKIIKIYLSMTSILILNDVYCRLSQGIIVCLVRPRFIAFFNDYIIIGSKAGHQHSSNIFFPPSKPYNCDR